MRPWCDLNIWYEELPDGSKVKHTEGGASVKGAVGTKHQDVEDAGRILQEAADRGADKQELAPLRAKLEAARKAYAHANDGTGAATGKGMGWKANGERNGAYVTSMWDQ
ncbi:hypothetical protein JKP88DRAFT_288713 [Tribonema minus]|uniref:Uncharacterized protein n=1 Tax=Tribonema minus TaxID=303371 RepID=A0A835ZCQ5_9STRA|nr:hypothetical protein JKP88DRAFT_288713 [Tribonema minus]